jgi:hypothetical protein
MWPGSIPTETGSSGTFEAPRSIVRVRPWGNPDAGSTPLVRATPAVSYPSTCNVRAGHR